MFALKMNFYNIHLSPTLSIFLFTMFIYDIVKKHDFLNYYGIDDYEFFFQFSQCSKFCVRETEKDNESKNVIEK